MADATELKAAKTLCERLVERALATGRKIHPIPDDVQIHTKAQMGGSNRSNAPREDHSWQYWLRLAERLDPSFTA